MTRLRQMAMAGLAALAIGGVASSASAMQTGTFQNRLNGATIGLPLGALPPAGLYTGLETAYLGLLAGNSNSGAARGNQGSVVLPAIAQAVPLLWVPGWNWWGATYSASIVQAFYIFTACGAGCGGSAPLVAGGFVYTNTFFNPINLSWNLGNGWFVSTFFNFTAPTGTHQAGTPNPDYWTFEPGIAFSYLSANSVASANLFYDINTKSGGVCCQQIGFGNSITSGNAFYADLMWLFKFGKWTIGPVGYTEIQTTADTGTCTFNTTSATGVVTANNVCGRYKTAAAGGLIGYNFGPVDLQVWVTDQFVGQDTPAGRGSLDVWTRIGFAIWNPEAPHPLVTKN